MARISFSSRVKGELARAYPEKACCCLAELAAIARQDGTVTIGEDDGIGFYIAAANTAVARKLYRLIKDLFSIEGDLELRRQGKQGKQSRGRLCSIRLGASEATTAMLRALGILSPKKQILPGIRKDLVKNKCCRRAYLRGAFLGGGSVNSPDSGYHLEFHAANEKLAADLSALINRFPGLQAKMSRRKHAFMVYLKEGDQIADILTIMGAYSHLLEFENARVMKGMSKQIRQIVNFETANLGKTVDASARQVRQINLIADTIGLDALEPSLAQVARMRLENPEINLKELGEIMIPPLGKSGVNHRLRKIGEIADKLAQP